MNMDDDLKFEPLQKNGMRFRRAGERGNKRPRVKARKEFSSLSPAFVPSEHIDHRIDDAYFPTDAAAAVR